MTKMPHARGVAPQCRVPWFFRGLLAIVPLCALPLALSSQTVGDAPAVLSAPYQLEGVQSGGTEIGDPSVQVLVGMGRAPDPESPDVGIPVPDSDALAWMTLLGTDGWVLAALVSIERRCEFMCSYDGPQECHWVGLYSPGGTLAEIGVPVAAIPGQLMLEEFTALTGAPDAPPDNMATLAVGAAPEPLLWEPWPDDWSPAYTVSGFDVKAGTLSLQYQNGDQTGSIDDANCTSVAREWLLTVNCGSVSVLAAGGKPLMLSQADYNSPAAQVMARFDHGGSRHYVVRFGAKAQDVVGLVSGEPAGWRARFRPRDWASLC